ncbi:MAG: S-adenosylmethionine decarboxylase [Chloroflexi bacterium]|nr:S-adenosylmethionine decarboxylase [Chloroflexota bacterium]
MHLAVDGYGADPEKLKDEGLVLGFLDHYPSSIGMTKIIPAQVYTYHGRTPEDWGISGFVLIAESHISVHTFPDRRHVNIDIFSCKDFDVDASLEEIEETFSLSETKVWTLDRGLDYDTPRAAYGGMVGERVRLLPVARISDAR